MKTYFLFAKMHSGKLVLRVITGHRAVLDEMDRITKLRAFYKDYEVYST